MTNERTEPGELQHTPCDDCGEINDTVVETVCPYDQDVNGKETPVTLCAKCYSLRCDEI